jgi:hypothetical protein
MIDGTLTEEGWSQAATITDLTQVEPVEGVPASPPTKILLMRDHSFLYVGFYCYEPAVDQMILQDMHRDGIQWEDDAVKIALDTFRDGKSGYYFLLSAAGSRLDALVADNGQKLNFNWNGFWQAESHIATDHWIAEVAIPFKTLAFGEEGIWRANFERWRGPDRSRSRWTGAQLEFRVTTMSEGGELLGFEGLEQGHGMEFLPYLKLKRTREHSPRSAHTQGDVGGEVSLRITPQLMGSLTINTDFAETEVDERRVNLTRFSLFFPEKRDFFLQDSNLFEFGWRRRHSSPDLIPFFSRRIGLSKDGEEIPIDYGGRLAGRIGDLELGMLSVRTGEDHSSGVPAGTLTVVRPAIKVSEELTLGGILTSGNPAERENNWVGGADLRFVSTDRLPGLFTLNAFALRSDDEAMDELGSAYGLRSSLNTGEWGLSMETIYTQDTFHPALGFVRRPGERRYAGQIEWEPRPQGNSVRNYTFSLNPTFWTEPDGTIISSRLGTELFGVEWHSGDRFFVEHILESDRLEEDFEPVDGSVIPEGKYDWQSIETGFIFSRSRPLSGSLTVEAGGWYNGRSMEYRAGSLWIPTAHLELGLSSRENQVRLPGDDFTTRIETVYVNYDFSPNLRLATLVQADNVSDNLGLQSRFRWIQSDGRELFVVVNASWLEEEDGSIVPEEQDFAIKLKYAIRF